MLLKTKYFGAVDCPDEERVHFAAGLFGFEEEKEFCLMPFQGSEGSLLCFQSVRTPQLAFVAMNPFSLKPDYAPVLTGEELRSLGVERSEELCFYALCVVRNPPSTTGPARPCRSFWSRESTTCATSFRSLAPGREAAYADPPAEGGGVPSHRG